MHVGFFTMNTDHSIAIDRLAREMEARGYESLWVGEHSHIPVQRETAYPGGGDLPVAYSRMSDPFVSLMAAGAAAPSLKLGTGVCLILERDLLETAKTTATLDRLTGGRLILGVGCGWNAEELRTHLPDLPFTKRYGAMRERVAGLRALWTEDESEFHGTWVNFGPLYSYPKPVQTPHPPVMLGNWGPVGMRHVVDYADEWGPVDTFLREPVARLAEARQQCEDAGRDPSTLPVTVFVTGNPAMATLEAYREAGVVRVVLGTGHPAMHREDKALDFLDRYSGAIADLN